jgi:hypothetical protein
MASDTAPQNEEHINVVLPPKKTLRISLAEWSTVQSFNSSLVPQYNKAVLKAQYSGL